MLLFYSENPAVQILVEADNHRFSGYNRRCSQIAGPADHIFLNCAPIRPFCLQVEFKDGLPPTEVKSIGFVQ